MRANRISYDPSELATLTLLGHEEEALRAAERAHSWARGLAYLSVADALRRQAGYNGRVRSLTRSAYDALPRRARTSYGLYSADFSRMLPLTNLHDPTTVARIDDFIAQLAQPQQKLEAATHLALALEGAAQHAELRERLAPLPPLASAIDGLLDRAERVAALAVACWRFGDQRAATALLTGLVAETPNEPNHAQRLPAYRRAVRAWERIGRPERADALWTALERHELSPGSRDLELYAAACARIDAGRYDDARRLLARVQLRDDGAITQVIDAYGRRGRPEEAEALIAELRDQPGSRRNQAHLAVAIAYAAVRRYDRAWELDGKIPPAVGSLHGQLMQTIAVNGLRHGDLADAQAAISKLAASWPQLLKPVIAEQAATGDWGGARATALSPGWANSRGLLLRHLAGLLLAEDRHAEAADAWRDSQRQD